MEEGGGGEASVEGVAELEVGAKEDQRWVFKETDRHEPGLRGRLAQRLDRQGGDILGAVGASTGAISP